jgi:hypothetical protein
MKMQPIKLAGPPSIIFGTEAIKEILPHRYPFLFLDGILEYVPNEYCIGVKNVTVNEYFFQGHFPGFLPEPMKLNFVSPWFPVSKSSCVSS